MKEELKELLKDDKELMNELIEFENEIKELNKKWDRYMENVFEKVENYLIAKFPIK